jgi:hypothetical protein
MCGARPDGRGEGVTETPRIDLCAAHAQEAAARPAAVDDDGWGAFVACGACLEASSFSAAGDCWDDWTLWALSPDEPVSDIQLLQLPVACGSGCSDECSVLVREAVPMVMVADGEVLIDTPATAFSNACYAVPETSAVQQPVLIVHSESDAFCTCVVVAEQNLQMDIPPELPVHSELQCADGVPFEEADEVRDVEWGVWTAFVETHIDSAAVVAVDALAVCKSSGWLTAVPALPVTVFAVISVGFVADIQRTLLLAVVYSALSTRCRAAFADSSSVAVELIDSGRDPPC